MSDFCKQCSHEVFGEDFRELAGLCKGGESVGVICEGCSDPKPEGHQYAPAGLLIAVDSEGRCLSQCMQRHAPWKPDPVFQSESGWYFYAECWTNVYGPFSTEAACREECTRYGKSL